MAGASCGYAVQRKARWNPDTRQRGKGSRSPAPEQDVEVWAPHWSNRDEFRLWAQRAHASRRAEKRYGVVIDARKLRELSSAMRDTRTKPGLLYFGRAKEGQRTAFWLVLVDAVEMLALYDEDTRQIATFLPMNATQIAFGGGRFHKLANGGSRQGRAYWSAR